MLELKLTTERNLETIPVEPFIRQTRKPRSREVKGFVQSFPVCEKKCVPRASGPVSDTILFDPPPPKTLCS